jgi:uncharacterized protein (TIGR02246 family)
MQLMQRLTGLLFLVLVCSQAYGQSAADGSAVRELAARWEQAWNHHDMKQLASLMTDDADFVNVGARHWKGRPEIEAEHSSRLPQFRDSVWSTNSIAVQFLEPGLGLVHVNWTMKGDREPDGTLRSPRSGLFTWVVVKRSGEWLIRAAQNTNQGPYAAQQSAAGTTSEAPDALIDAFVRAWNSHDMEAFARLFTVDATWAPTFDVRDEGREAIVADLRRAHENWAKTSTLTASKTAVKLLRPDVATVQFNVSVTVNDSGQPLGRTLLLAAIKQEDGWKISAGQLTKPNCP